jgi:hypothetical protein
MTFRARKPDLVERQLANMDKQLELRKNRRTYLLQAEAERDPDAKRIYLQQAEACRIEDLQLERENEEISWQLRPDTQSNVAFLTFRDGLRPRYGYVEPYADAA